MMSIDPLVVLAIPYFASVEIFDIIRIVSAAAIVWVYIRNQRTSNFCLPSSVVQLL